jgi:hypothetical protein
MTLRRQFLCSSSLLLACQARAQEPQQEPHRMGLHGMALFGGREGLLASHLPMFHTPHDVQLLLRIRLQDAGLDAQVRHQLATQPQLWTVEPERFDLSRLHAGSGAPLQNFKANLVQGHFERGGAVRYAQVSVVVEQVLVFNRLLPAFRQAGHQRFFWFGQGREQFLVKWLDQRPDVDLIGRFTTRKPQGGQRLLTLPSGPLAPPPAALMARALRDAGALVAQAPQWLYVETGDLA